MYVLQRAFHAVTKEMNPWLHQLDPYTITRIRSWLLDGHTTRPKASAAILTLSSAIKAGRLEGAIQINPLNLIDWMIQTDKKERVISREEWKTLHTECRKEGIDLELRAGLGYYLGLRISEAYGIKVGDINLTDQLITAPTRKGNARANKPPTRILPIPPALEPILHHAMKCLRPGTRPEDLIFTALSPKQGQKPGHIQRATYAWLRARGRAGLEDVRFHDLRHTFATRMHEAGGSTHDLMQALGHTQEASVARYVHPDAERIRRFIK